jgi:hypothetical protein
MRLLRRLANLERLTRARGGGRCTECAGLPDYAVAWPETAALAPVTCQHCGWQPELIRVVYVDGAQW